VVEAGCVDPAAPGWCLVSVTEGTPMKKLLTGIVAVALVAATGCKNESAPGGPGANSSARTGAHAGSTASSTTTTSDGTRSSTTTTTHPDATAEAKDNSFTVKVPSTTTKIKQGNNQDVTISLSRGKEFKEDVKLLFKPAEGLKVEPPDATIKGDQDSTKVLVHADDKASPGNKTVEVIATPATGKPTTVSFTVDVTTP